MSNDMSSMMKALADLEPMHREVRSLVDRYGAPAVISAAIQHVEGKRAAAHHAYQCAMDEAKRAHRAATGNRNGGGDE